MTITRLWQSGAETGTLLEFSSIVGAPTAQTTTKYTDGYAYSMANNAQNIGVVDVTATRQVRIGARIRINNNITDNEVGLLDVRASSTQLAGLHMKGDTLNLIADVAGTNQDTDSYASDVWYHMGVDIKIHSSAGWIVVYKDLIEIMRFEGNTGNSDITNVTLGPLLLASFSGTTYMDDIYIDDTTGEATAAVVPARSFQYVIPTGNGNYNGNWTGSDGNSVDNYLLVDEIPAASADYIEETVTDQLESFLMDTYTLAANEGCVAVIPIVLCQRTGATELIALGTRYSATDVIGSDLTPPASYLMRFERQTTKPGGGAWDQTAIDGFELVMKSRGTY